MPVLLTDPLESVPLERIRVAAIKWENNPLKGQQWVEIWLTLVHLVGEDLVQYVDPNTGDEAHYIKVEDGVHPLAPDTALGKCDTCAAWYARTTGECDEIGCEGTVQPHPCYARLCAESIDPTADCVWQSLRKGVYNWLLSEDVPDPDTWVVRKILDGSLED